MSAEVLQELFEPVSKDLERFDRLLDQVLDAESPLISRITHHLLGKKGKRIRPSISFLINRTAGLTHPRMISAALAIELLHIATLLHDDVVDESEMRRGQLTVNSKWNNLVAVLMGDFFFAKAFRLLVSTEDPALIKAVSIATERVSFGELRQTEESFNWGLSEEEYYRIIRDKTSALFSVSAAAGAILTGVNKKAIKDFIDFGDHVGTAFQIIDDILDLTGDAHRTGKSVGLDLLQGKITLPLIFALRESSKNETDEALKLLNNGLNRRGLKKILGFICAQGGIEYARDQAAGQSGQAMEFISKFPASRYRRSLENLIRFSINRDN